MKFLGWIQRLIFGSVAQAEPVRIQYNSITYLDSIADIQRLKSNQIVLVRDGHRLKWAALKCPCGCGEIIQVPLMKSVSPHWDIRVEENNTITLSPSLWRAEGCKSHFFLRAGRVFWCEESDYDLI